MSKATAPATSARVALQVAPRPSTTGTTTAGATGSRELKVAGVILALLVAAVGGPIGLLVAALVGVAYYLYVNRIADEAHETLSPMVLRAFRVALESRHRPNANEILQRAWDILRNPKFRALAEGMAFEARTLVMSAGKSDQELIGEIQLQLLIDILLRNASETTPAWLCRCGGLNLSKEASCSLCGTSSITIAALADPTLRSPAPSLLSGQRGEREWSDHRTAASAAALPPQTCPACTTTSDAAAVFCGRCGSRLLRR